MDKTKTKEEIRKLSNLLRLYQHEYYVLASPSVSDLEYDRLFDQLLKLEKENPDLIEPDSPTARVGSDLSTNLDEVEHTIPVLSLDKAYSIEEVKAWMLKTINNAGEKLSFSIEEKIDGISVVLYYEDGLLIRAVTRGNGFVGNDITSNVKTIGSIPLKLSKPVNIAVRGEIYLPKDRFEKLNKKMEVPYANPRNLAAGTVRRIKSCETAAIPLNIFVYEGFFENQLSSHYEIIDNLMSLGFRVNPRFMFFTNPNNIETYIKKSTEDRLNLPYEIDGLVIKVNEIAARDKLGYTGHHPRWAIAYKFESLQAETLLKNIEIQVGRTGRITPVGRVEPVQIGGSTVSNVTLHNQDYINMLEVAPGDIVALSRRGDVIPAIEKLVEKGPDSVPSWQMPQNCPSCKSRLIKKGAHHFCLNKDCPAQIKGRILFFIGKSQMDIENFGPETVEILINKGLLKDVEDIYSCNYDLLLSERGFGDKKIKLIKDGIIKSLKQPYKRVLCSLGITELGQKAAELIINNGFPSIDNLLSTSEKGDYSSLLKINGIGEKTAEIIFTELQRPDVKKRILALKAAGLNFKIDESEKINHDDSFNGQNWCITGSFEKFKPRDTALEEIKKRGGKTVNTITSKTTHLLCGKGGGSKKTKAKNLGVKIITEEEFLTML